MIVRSDGADAGTPYYLKGRFVIHSPQGSSLGNICERLLKELYEVETAPPLGEVPLYLSNSAPLNKLVP